jgi:CRISPR system Cascade subunit CasB
MVDEATQAGAFVQRKISQLIESGNESAARATLAKLRRGIGKAPGSLPELWNVTLEGLPETLIGRGNEPTRGEWAVHTALTLYALHQQGKDLKKQRMSCDGEYLGAAVRRLIRSDEDEPRIKRRFDAVATSESLEEFAHHLRGLVQLLKAEDIPLDYPSLAKEIYWFQFSEARDSIRLHWGRDFYRTRENKDSRNQQV